MAEKKGKVKKIKTTEKKDPFKLIMGVSVAMFVLMLALGIMGQLQIIDTEGTTTIILDEKGRPVAGANFAGRILMADDRGTVEPWLLLVSVNPEDPENDIAKKVQEGVYTLRTVPVEKGFFLGDPKKDSLHADGDMVNFVVLAVLPLIGPIGFYTSIRDSKINRIEARIPDFLRDVAEAGRFGLTLAESVVIASNGRYGTLTPEIEKMAAQIRWNIPVGEAMRLFSERVPTPLVVKVTAIVIKSNDAGGDVADVLTLVSTDAKEAQMMLKERRLAMSTYIAVIYISFFVFLVTILILTATFLPQMEEAGRATKQMMEDQGIEGASTIQSQAIPAIQFIFLVAAVLHGIGDGMIAGTLDTGKPISGFKHSFIMIIAAFAFLRM